MFGKNRKGSQKNSKGQNSKSSSRVECGSEARGNANKNSQNHN